MRCLDRAQHVDDDDHGVAWGGPLVVLCSKLSASASEIFAGAIQDYHRGLIVGDHTTHGKGTVQTMVDLNRPFAFLADRYPKLGSLKLTIQKFYRPSGESTQESGEGKDESIVERMEQAAQRAREESGQGTDVSQADQQQDMPGSPSTDV